MDRSIKVDEAQIEQIKQHIASTGQTIKGFISVAITEELRRQKKCSD